jgi:hypothetical protein
MFYRGSSSRREQGMGLRKCRQLAGGLEKYYGKKCLLFYRFLRKYLAKKVIEMPINKRAIANNNCKYILPSLNPVSDYFYDCQNTDDGYNITDYFEHSK